MSKSALDKDLQRVSGLETATHDLSRTLAAPGIALVFLLVAGVWASFAVGQGPGTYVVVIAALIAGYMALNVGANDVANNMGPAVGSRALTMVGALVIAAIFEAAGALLAGGDVVNTVARDLLISPDLETRTFVVDAFDTPRRSIDLALPGVTKVDTGAPPPVERLGLDGLPLD